MNAKTFWLCLKAFIMRKNITIHVPLD